MATYLHPGVYIEEVPGSRTIEGVSTDLAVFIGVAEAGPFDKPTLITSWDDYLRIFGQWMFNRYLPFAVYAFFTKGGRSCYVVRAKPTKNLPPATASLDPLAVTATSEGSWPQEVQVQIANYPDSGGTDTTPVFTLNVLASTTQSGQSFGAAMLQQFAEDNESKVVEVEGTHYYLLEEFAGFSESDVYSEAGQTCPLETQVNGSSLFIRIAVAAGTKPTRPANNVAPFSGAEYSNFDFSSAIKSTNELTGFSLAAIPDSVGYSTKGTGEENPVDQRAVIQSLLTDAELRTDYFVVADPPFGLDVSQIKEFKEGTGDYAGNALNSEYGALYYPWIRFLDTTSGNKLIVPPSGSALGRYAATDNTTGVFKAPAGVESGKLRLATGLETQVSETQQDLLNPAGIDVIRTILQYGICIYGARTISLNAEWRYVNVRRSVIYVERSVYEGIQWVVFEPNSPQLWGMVIRDVTAFLTTFWLDGGLFGTTPQEAFYVICDQTNNPPETRDQGELYIDIGLALVKPAEFVIVRITQKTAESDS